MRTTQAPCLNILKILPELQQRARTTVRLHPRPAQVGPLDASKLGGRFLWPADEVWPHCDVHDLPFVGALQLSAREVPELQYKPGTDLFQILWCARDHESADYGVLPRCYWRDAASISQPLTELPCPSISEDDSCEDEGLYVPAECELHPETVIEYPHYTELDKLLRRRLEDCDLGSIPEVQERLEIWRRKTSFPFEPGEWLYISELSVAPGTKVGGHVDWIQESELIECGCGRQMEHLLTISSLESLAGETRDYRWAPMEERDLPAAQREQMAYGTELMFGDGGSLYFFICRHCEDWPIRSTWQCG